MQTYTISVRDSYRPTTDDLDYLASVGMTYSDDTIKFTVSEPYMLHRAKAALRMIPSQRFYDSLIDNLSQTVEGTKKKPKIVARSCTFST